MAAGFSASQTIDMPMPPMRRPVAEYLRQPHRVALAAAQPGHLVALGGDRYRLSVPTLTFAHLQFQPMVDLRVWTDEAGVVRMRSVGCQLVGLKGLDNGFSLELTGQMRAISTSAGDRLKGVVDLGVRVKLPPPLDRLPATTMQSTGQLLLTQVLAKMKYRLVDRLSADYRRWATESTSASLPLRSIPGSNAARRKTP
ncbi:MAG: DUF1997 domain-containing protein [Limnothrix sp.]|nr:DUF1997 domain-containing protein [Limnothrix sp.]